jgi:hypothetical protein
MKLGEKKVQVADVEGSQTYGSASQQFIAQELSEHLTLINL